MGDGETRVMLAVGEVARRSGVAVSTVHFYEAKGLIAGERTQGNQRRYHRSVLRRIAIIRIAQRAGIPLATVNDALRDLPHDHTPNARDWRHFTETWKEMLEERISGLIQLRDQLTSCIGCGCLSLEDCPLRNPDDELGKCGSGPRRLLSSDEPPDEDPALDLNFG